MNEFSFEKSGAEIFIESCHENSILSACSLLAMISDEDDETIEEVFDLIHKKRISLNLADIPASPPKAISDRLDFELRFVKEGADISTLPENDPLRICMSDLSEYNESNEVILYSQFRDGSDVSNELFLAGMPRAVKLSLEYVNHGILLADLIQDANLALWQAISDSEIVNYIEASGYTVRSALEKTVVMQARNDGIGNSIRDYLQNYQRISQSILKRTGRNPEVEEVAQVMRLSPEIVSVIQKMVYDAQTMPSHTQEQQDNPDIDMGSEEEAIEDTAYYKLRERVSDLLQQLPAQDAQILSLRFGLDRKLPLTTDETARVLNMTKDEIMKREAAALAILRDKGSR